MGERIFDIEVAPPLAGQKYGDIWMASSLGLARYSPTTEKWSYRTRVEGLPEDQVQALAFDKQGRLYAGTQCHGVAIADAADDYTSWRRVTGPDPFSNEPAAEGIPTDLINDVLVSKDGTVYVATSHGLAKSGDRGETWSFIRGRDWEAMVKGLDKGPRPEGKADPNGLLAEDYITSLSEDVQGNLWIGYRQKGYEAYETGTGRRLADAPKKGSFYTFTILAASTYPPLCGAYGGGLHSPDGEPAVVTSLPVSMTDFASIPPLPEPAQPPTSSELDSMAVKFAALGNAPTRNPQAVYLGEDWATQGDWVGRYGRQYSVLCATCSPLDHSFVWNKNAELFIVRGQMGPHKHEKDNLRHWCWQDKSDERRVLYNPYLGYRRPAGWDDHAEAYPWTHEGPDMWVAVDVPQGIHQLSLYFLNFDGHGGNNRFRDYLIELRERNDDKKGRLITKTRVRDFWPGMYKSFVIDGPASYFVRIGKNNSFNTMVSGVFIDRLQGPPTTDDDRAMEGMAGVYCIPPQIADSDLGNPLRPTLRNALNLWNATSTNLSSSNQRICVMPSRLHAYRTIEDGSGPGVLVANWSWHLKLWYSSDRQWFDNCMKLAWDAFLGKNPHWADRKRHRK